MVTKIGTGDDVRDRYHVQNFIRIRSGISLPARHVHGASLGRLGDWSLRVKKNKTEWLSTYVGRPQ